MRSIESVMTNLASNQVQVVEPVSGSGRFALVGRQLDDGSFLIAVFSLSDVDQAALILRRQLVAVTIVLLAVAILLAILLSMRLSRPIQAVTAAARELAAGHLDIQLPVGSQDEIGQLTTALNDLSQQLRQNDRLQKELIANVSHELRSPLAVIRGYAEMVRDVTWPDEKKRTDQLTMIAAESARLTAVVQDILDYSRLEAGVEKIVLSRFNICPVCEQLIGRYLQKATSLGLELQLDCQSLPIQFDRARLDQVLNNLLDNAINHAYSGSTVRISVQPVQERQPSVSNSDQTTPAGRPMARIAVHNSGPTIPPDELPRIWDRYHQAGRQGSDRLKGTGLGLSIVRSICEQHRVPYGVTSSQDQTTFWFSAELDGRK
jgi:signal transduction histidine kinase